MIHGHKFLLIVSLMYISVDFCSADVEDWNVCFQKIFDETCD